MSDKEMQVLNRLKAGPVLSLITLLLVLATVRAHGDPAVPAGRRLREIVAANFRSGTVLIGATTGSWAFGTDQAMVMDREFSYVTPENDFKQSIVHPEPDTWNWSRSDPWVQHVRENDQVLRMHGPVGPQCSGWAKDDSRTAEELEQNMREFLTALCRRYNSRPKFEYMDVVNETVLNGKWHTDRAGSDWECPWFRIGQDTDPRETPLYIKYAFEIANEHAPDLKLIYNHHESTANTASWDLIKETTQYLRDQGLRIDGIGWQAHVGVGWDTSGNLRSLSQLITWAHANELEFHITEASVFVSDESDAQLEAQARTYRRIVEVLLVERRGGPVGWNTWHISDAHGWRKDEYPSLFDDHYDPKPAYYALQRELEEHQDLPVFLRGDCNDDGAVDISDAVSTLLSLFVGVGDPGCDDPCDSNDDGAVDISDAITTLGVLFLGQGQIPLPGRGDCGPDPTMDELMCESFPRCE